MTSRTWFRIHSFTGVVTGLLLFVICWSGTFAVISNEIDWLVTPELRVQPQAEHASWSTIKAVIESAYPKATLSSISASLYHHAATVARIKLPDGGGRWVFVDPYSGRITGTSSGFTIQRFFRDFHRHLFVPGKSGIYIVTVFGFTLLVSIIAPLFFYKRWWTRFFRFKRGRGRIFWSELHKTAGLWSFWFALIIAVTGVWYLVEAARYDIGDGIIAYAGDADFAVHEIPAPAAETDLSALSLEDLIGRARQLRPELRIRNIRFPGDGSLYVDGKTSHLLVRDRANQVHLDTRTGEALYNQNASDYPLYWRWSDTADPLHFGNFGGLTSKLIWFLFGLILSGLILTGTYLHAQRLARQVSARHHRWPGTTAALLISLFVLATAVPFGFYEAYQFYGPTIDGSKQLPTLPFGVKVFIASWTTMTLGIIAGWIWLFWRSQPSAHHVTP